MLPRKLHIEQINRFHDKFIQLNEEIERVKDREDLIGYSIKLHRQYIELTKIWEKIDYVTEFDVKSAIDAMEEV